MDNLVIDLFYKKIIYKNKSIKINYDLLLSQPYLINNIVKFMYDKIKLFDYTNIIGTPGLASHISSILTCSLLAATLMSIAPSALALDWKVSGNTMVTGNYNNDEFNASSETASIALELIITPELKAKIALDLAEAYGQHIIIDGDKTDEEFN